MRLDPIELAQRVRAALPGFTFRPPATELDVQRVERELGFRVPADLRRLYLQYNGLHGRPRSNIELLPLVGAGDPDGNAESVLGWNLFRKGSGWEQGYEPPRDVLELGFLSDDAYVGVRSELAEVVIVYRRGNEVEPVRRDLAQLLADAYQEESKLVRCICAGCGHYDDAGFPTGRCPACGAAAPSAVDRKRG